MKSVNLCILLDTICTITKLQNHKMNEQRTNNLLNEYFFEKIHSKNSPK